MGQQGEEPLWGEKKGWQGRSGISRVGPRRNNHMARLAEIKKARRKKKEEEKGNGDRHRFPSETLSRGDDDDDVLPRMAAY